MALKEYTEGMGSVFRQFFGLTVLYDCSLKKQIGGQFCGSRVAGELPSPQQVLLHAYSFSGKFVLPWFLLKKIEEIENFVNLH